jgi:uncharacterized protein
MSVLAKVLENMLPQEDKFYHLLEDLVAQAERSVRALRLLIQGSPENTMAGRTYANTTTLTLPNEIVLTQASDTIVQAKGEARHLVDTLTAEVCRTFITPFDREDLQAFAVDLYKIPKTIDKIRVWITLLPQQRIRLPYFTPQVDIICQQAEAMTGLVHLLSSARGSKMLQEKTNLLNILENEGDIALAKQLAELFQTPNIEAHELVWAKELLELLEHVVDQYKEVANITLRIVLKHS